ncbi:unnamed protein product [Cuscuta campestris]|uniref:MRN complex-interacting protein N-terminal domain-containing protein n=2 Tax=Cuscuta sect. Cleistogrammica TaxID=1824901 RepID=A0A484LDF7_9ASTE|nr:hypothetical protein DM860_009589 [Cuscuta australis]VFQ74410.1 unnamed protein product [Cuscuta campestris]
MQTLFIALQCCQCFTMQVKQRKKSGNKWVCVVCNQKQSVRNVFAEGFMARDVRKFVQSFNMSRQLADQQIHLHQQEEPQTLIWEGQFPGNGNNSSSKKRTDWTEYLDFEDGSVEQEDEQSTEDGMETRIVTELPKAMFKRPKLSSYMAGSESDSQNRFRPVFTKRNARKQSSSQNKEGVFGTEQKLINVKSADVGPMAKRAPEWEDGKSMQFAKSNEFFLNGESSKGSLLTTGTAKGEIISKWSDYLTTDEDDCY